MKHRLLLLAPLLMAAAPPQRSILLERAPAPVIPTPRPDAPVVAPERYAPAPLPNRDVSGPLGPRATNDPTFEPKLFNRSDQYRGSAIDPRSSSQADQERRVLPGAGFNLRIPQ